MSCKYLCQVGALECVGACSDRCESPAGAGMIEHFERLWLISSPAAPTSPQGLTTSTVPGHCPLLPLRDPVIESNEHCVYFGRATERSRRRGYKGRKRQIKDSTKSRHVISQEATIVVVAIAFSRLGIVAKPHSNGGKVAKNIYSHHMRVTALNTVLVCTSKRVTLLGE